MGYVGWIGGNLGIEEEQTHLVESQLVKELLSLGAVLYCKSSLPQTLLVSDHLSIHMHGSQRTTCFISDRSERRSIMSLATPQILVT